MATAWGSKHGGINVFNYRMCRGLAALGHSVICYVKEYTTGDLDDAQKQGVTLMAIQRSADRKWTLEDVGYIKYGEVREIDVLVVHDILCKTFLDHFPTGGSRKLVAAFIHTLYRETDYFGDLSDDDRNAKDAAQRELMKMADQAVAQREGQLQRLGGSRSETIRSKHQAS